MESNDLISASISDEDKEGSVVRLDAILYERWDPLVELLLLHSDHVHEWILKCPRSSRFENPQLVGLGCNFAL